LPVRSNNFVIAVMEANSFKTGAFYHCKTVLLAGCGLAALQLFHYALDERFGVGNIFHDDLNVHHRLARPALALAVHTMLTDECQRVGKQVHADSQPPARQSHHGFIMIEFVVLLVEDAHLPIVTGARHNPLFWIARALRNGTMYMEGA